MNEHTPRRLRWWFWVMLLAPAVSFVLVTPLTPVMKIHLQGAEIWIARAVWASFAVMNLLCSLGAAAYLERALYGRVSAWTIPVGLAFFFLNLVLSFGGCMVGANLFR